MRNSKFIGVTIPSQLRYIEYFHDAYNQLIVNSYPILLRKFVIKFPSVNKKNIFIEICNVISKMKVK